MSKDKGKLKIVAMYDMDKDDFFVVSSNTSLNPDSQTYMIIDEFEKKITLSFPESAGLIQKRTIERRVASYLKIGFPVGDKGLRVGANFPLSKAGAEEALPKDLITHGYSFGRELAPEFQEGQQVPQNIVEKKRKTKRKRKGKASAKSEPSYQPPPQKSPIPIEEPAQVSQAEDIHPTEILASQEEDIYALGEFVAMLVSQGNKVLVSYSSKGAFELKTVKEIQKTETITVKEKSYVIEANELFEM